MTGDIPFNSSSFGVGTTTGFIINDGYGSYPSGTTIISTPDINWGINWGFQKAYEKPANNWFYYDPDFSKNLKLEAELAEIRSKQEDSSKENDLLKKTVKSLLEKLYRD